MTNERGHHDRSSEHQTDADRDLLITRAIDGRASAIDWATMEALAGRDPSFWRELALAQRDQRVLERLVGVATGVADSVDLPQSAVIGTIAHTEQARGGRPSGLRIWGGWIAAAILFVAILSGRLTANLPEGTRGKLGGNEAGVWPVGLSSDQYIDRALSQGRQDGRVIGEYGDPYVLATEPASDGKGYTVVYIRPILMKRHVEGVYEPSYVSDETGQVRSVKAKRLVPGGVGY